MDYSKLRLFSLLNTKMQYSAEKHEVIAENIANADTPGYKAKKLRDLDFKRLALTEARRLRVRATNESHISKSNAAQTFRVETQRKTHEMTPVKNHVAIEEQMAMMAHNKHEYEMTTAIYKKTTNLVKIALGKGQ